IKLRRCYRVGSEDRHSAHPRRSFDQDFLPLAVKLSRENADSSDIAGRSRHRGYETGSRHIVGKPKDWDGLCGLLRGMNGWITSSLYCINSGIDQISGEL